MRTYRRHYYLFYIYKPTVVALSVKYVHCVFDIITFIVLFHILCV